MRHVFIATLSELAERDDRIFLITGDLGFGVLDDYRRRFPRQFLNAGVAEQNMTGLATGLALEGRTVFTYSIANFPILRCLEQIRNDAAYHCANVKIVSIGGGFSYGALGMSHHATEDLAILRALPDVTVVAPGDNWETAEATKAIVARAGVCYLRLDRSAAVVPTRPNERFELGRARAIRRGARVAFVTCGSVLGEVLCAADLLQQNGLNATVVSLHTLKPIDANALCELASQHEVVVTVEEHVLAGGLGSAVAEVLADANATPRRLLRLGLDGKTYVSAVGSQDYLRKQCGLDGRSIAARVSQATLVYRAARETGTNSRS